MTNLNTSDLTVAAEGEKAKSRQIVAGTGIAISDGGAGSGLTISATILPAADLTLQIDGRLAVIADVGAFPVSRTYTINRVYIRAKTKGTASSTIIDVHLNGTTIFTTQSNRPTLAYDDTDGIASGIPDVTSLSAGDLLTVDIDQAATGAADLSVVISVSGTAGSEAGGGANPLSELATYSIKNAPIADYAIAAEETKTIFSYTGSGMVLSIWNALSGTGFPLDGTIKVYVDGEVSPSVQFDVGTLGLHYLTGEGIFTTKHVAVESYLSHGGKDSYLFKYPIPFGSSIRIDMYSPAGCSGHMYSIVTYTTDITSTKRLKSAGVTYLNHVNGTPAADYDLIDLETGSGVVVWTSLVGVGAGDTFMESDIDVYVGGEATASIQSTGTEDWFTSGWYFYGGGPQSRPWMFCSVLNTGSHITVVGLDLMELNGGIKFTNGVRINWGLTESSDNVEFSYLILYYEGT